jgi:hypothetical protein
MKRYLLKFISVNLFILILSISGYGQTYPIVGTSQTKYYNNVGEITAPAPGQPYYGQAAFYQGNVPSYTDNGDGTITDNVTGLMWVKARGSKIAWSDAVAGASTNRTANYSDWRMPTIKELYSLIQFSGVNGPDNTNIAGYIPYIDTTYFDFAYGPGGSTSVGERIIDCQDWSANKYVSKVMVNQSAIFGVNFADGRIKGYNELVPSTGAGNILYVRYVRGNTNYGKNDFKDNGDNTITDQATGLMWSKDDSKTGLDWPGALAWVQTQNAANYLGHNDWRLPDSKELQSIVDYTRSPSTTSSPAIDVDFFNTTSITNEAGQTDYPYFWTSSVLLDGGPFPSGIYISFGRAMGYMNSAWIDVHGAGSQKSDMMVGNPADYPTGRGPQGDAVHIYNYVRLVRTASATTGLNELNSKSLLNIYPNPTSDIININLSNLTEKGNLVIYNQYGASIYNKNISAQQEIKIDVSNFPKGLFLIQITEENKILEGKFIVQ